jgi:hypothetical protein
MKARHALRRRTGSILVLSAVMMVAMFAMLAMAVDLGYVALVRTQSQNSADAAALAATCYLMNAPGSVTRDLDTARDTAEQFAGYNRVGGLAPELASADVAFGRYEYSVSGGAMVLDFANPSAYNATRVRVHRAEVPTFFARVLGIHSASSQAEATAAFLDNFSGFKLPTTDTRKLGVLPFAMDWQTWDDLMKGRSNPNISDHFKWDEDAEEITSGVDGIAEVNLYPQGTGSPGNRGTVDIGDSNNSTADISRQVREGISAADLAKLLPKTLELGPDGTLQLGADTGISAGMKDDLLAVRGQPRCILLFDFVSGSGDNAKYTIVGFAGVRIMEVVLTGAMRSKRVLIQPARIEMLGGIPATDGVQHSSFMHSPVFLVK